MIRYLAILLIVITGICGRAQPGFKKTFAFGDHSNSVFQGFDISRIGPHFYSYGIGRDLDSSLQTVYVLKSDEYGNIIDHRYLHDGSKKNHAFWLYVVNYPEMAVLDNGNFVFVVEEWESSNHKVFCVDTSLSIVWTTTIARTPNVSAEITSQLASDGNDVYIGCKISPKANNPYYTRIIKIDGEGNILWSKTSQTISVMWGLEFDHEKKSLYLSGSNIESDTFFYNYIIKMDTSLTILEQSSNFRNGLYDFGFNVVEIPNTVEFISPSYDIKETPWYSTDAIGTGYALNITRRDKDLNPVWKIPLYPSTSHNNGIATIIPSRDGNYFSLAQVVSFMFDVGGMSTGFSDSVPIMNSLITKFTADGQVIWQRKDTVEYFAPTNHCWTEVGGIYAMEDGGVMVNGVCSRRFLDKPEQMRGWIMRIGADGCLMPGDCGISSVKDMDDLSGDIILYPNPTTGIVHFDISALPPDLVSCRVYDNLGIIVRKVPPADLSNGIDLTGQRPGLYFVELATRHSRFVKKIIFIQ